MSASRSTVVPPLPRPALPTAAPADAGEMVRAAYATSYGAGAMHPAPVYRVGGQRAISTITEAT